MLHDRKCITFNICRNSMIPKLENGKISDKTAGTLSSCVNQHLLHLCLICRDCGALRVMMVSPVYQVSLVNQDLQDILLTQE